MFDFSTISNLSTNTQKLLDHSEAKNDVNSVERDKLVLFRPEHTYNAFVGQVWYFLWMHIKLKHDVAGEWKNGRTGSFTLLPRSSHVG